MYRIVIKKKAKKFIDRLPLNEKSALSRQSSICRMVKILRNSRVMMICCVCALEGIESFIP